MKIKKFSDLKTNDFFEQINISFVNISFQTLVSCNQFKNQSRNYDIPHLPEEHHAKRVPFVQKKQRMPQTLTRRKRTHNRKDNFYMRDEFEALQPS